MGARAPLLRRALRSRPGLLLAVGAAIVALVAWRIDLGAVRAAVANVGWGIVLIVGQELVAHACNALGWRLAFTPSEARSVRFAELLRLRMVGDAVNYLTPTATLGGEVVRATLLGRRGDPAARVTSVVVAKAAQTAAQAVFVVGGLSLFAARLRVPGVARLGAGVLALALAAVLAWVVLRSWGGHLAARVWRHVCGPQAMAFVVDHPARTAASVLMFGAGYAWGVVEAFVICRFVGVPVPVATAVAIEVLSITLDAMLFVVPAKIGTQEAGKLAVFTVLGLPGALGVAFGVVRHARELVWAAVGMCLCGRTVVRDGLRFTPRLVGPADRSPAV